MNPEELRALIEDAVRRAVQPLEQELKSLRLELQGLKNASRAASNLDEETVQDAEISNPSSQMETDEAPHTASQVVSLPEINTEIPAERTDFARFLQRGLEQEAHDYSQDNLRKEAPKKRGGWNPFKR
jgi:hypothetical protein